MYVRICEFNIILCDFKISNLFKNVLKPNYLVDELIKKYELTHINEFEYRLNVIKLVMEIVWYLVRLAYISNSKINDTFTENIIINSQVITSTSSEREIFIRNNIL